MKASRYFPILAIGSLCGVAASCNEDVSDIGSSIVSGEVNIIADSTLFDLKARSVETPPFDSRSTFNLLGRLYSPEYGDLRCSFVGQLMSAYPFPVADSIASSRVDSVVMMVSVPRGYLTGDSLAPQQLTVYPLTKQLPADIANNFDPQGYYDPSRILGRRSYTLSEISSSDSVFAKSKYVHIKVNLPREFGMKTFDDYRSNPEIFQWPQSFAKYFPGIYVEPSFGRGCVASVAGVNVFTYYHHYELREVTEDSVKVTKQVTVKDSVDLFALAPEALNSNNISYSVAESLRQKVAAGEVIATTPGGYAVEVTFPVREIIKKYKEKEGELKVISDLTFALPATNVPNDYDISVCPQMLLIKKSEMDSFFAENKLPDSTTSFWANYDSTKGRYNFSSMRKYIIDLLDKTDLTEEDEAFMLVPVLVTTEEVTNQYTGQVTTYVIGCEHYLARPTMTKFFTDRAQINFTFSEQIID